MKNKIIISVVLVSAIVLIVNLISQDFFIRLDFSEGKQYTLSNATRDILKNLSEPVTVKAYFSENLPPQVSKAKKDFKEMLIEYNSRSKGNLVYEFVDPSKNEDLEREAQQDGIQPIMIQVRENDQMKQQKAYLGAVISMGDRKEVLPVIQPGEALEYTISKAIKKLSIVEKPALGILQGHGEPPIQEIAQAYNELNVMYNVEPLTLSDTTQIPERIKILAIIRPKDTVPSSHLAQLDQFLSRGGNMFVASSRVNADLQHATASVLNTGLETWLKGKGISLADNVVTDASCSQIQVVQQSGGFQMARQLEFPYIPIVRKFGSHSISSGLEGISLPFSSQVEFLGNSGLTFSPIVFSSEKSSVEQLPVYFNVEKQWTEADFPKKEIVIGGVLEGKLSGDKTSKMVVIGCGDFAINGPQNQAQQLPADNISLLANSVDWLSDDTGLIALRTKSITARPIEEMSDASKATLKWINFLLPIILVLAYGFFRAQVKRNQRIKRLEENYV